MAAVAVCNDSPQVADATAFSSCTSVVWIDASELPTQMFAGVTVDSMAPVYSAILLLWAAAYGIRKAIDAVGT